MMDEQIRVRTETRYAELYDDLKRLVVGEFHNLFFICASLGYSANKRKTLSKAQDRFWSKTITPWEWTCYYAMLLKDENMDLNTIADDKKVIRVIEEYSNAGMEIFLEELLSNFLLAGQKVPRIDQSASKELSKVTLGYIFSRCSPDIEAR